MNFDYEKGLMKDGGYGYVAGIDEAGRGPLAGPVVACCFMFLDFDRAPKDVLPKIKDSKLLSEIRRSGLINEFFKWRNEGIVDFEYAYVTPRMIDKINIQNATILAMKRAFSKMAMKPDYVVVDKISYKKKFLPCEYELKVKADMSVISCACASIVAKVYRDAKMIRQDMKYPGYGFVNNKGYGTKEHYNSIGRQGITPIHRRSFRLK